MSHSTAVSRRDFLVTTGAVASTVAMSAASYAKVIVNDRIRIGLIGAGGIAQMHFGACKELKREG